MEALAVAGHPWRPTKFPNHSTRFRFRLSSRYRPDSNAESFTSQKFNSNFKGRQQNPEPENEEDFDAGVRFGSRRKKRRRWWSDEPSSEFEEEEPSSGVFDQVIDSVWILKVFKSYGWTLQPIIISLLLNTGPKAFLMALALPLVQSILSLAFDKLWGTPERKPKRRTRSKARKRPFYSTGNRVQEEVEEADERWEEKGKMGGYGYRSWEVDSSNGEVQNEGRNGNSFGGWEDLDGIGYQRKSSGMRGKKQSISMEKDDLSWRESKSDTPLLLRLLIAVFPFLGSWTRML